jgi:acyl carrier protein
MARWRADGTVQFIGRRDGQVKVRGYRIELGEIESVLRTHPGVADCAVVVRQEESGEIRLVAYAVTDDGTPLSAEGARATLRDRLPEYMVPPVFVTLPQLPLTPNGKVDRKALSIKALPDETRDERIAVLMTPAQRRVANIWETLLGSTAVGLHNNFFDLGGHSLLAVRLHGALRREFGVEFPLIDLFQHTTVAAQAERLASLSTGEPMLAASEVTT